MENIEATLTSYSLMVLAIGTVLLAILALISLKVKKLSHEAKKTLFLSIIVSTIIPTIVMSFSTIYLNTISSSKGPVHWHADFQVFACGQEYELKDPKGLSNKIGTATLHEHNDKRIHLEGVVVTPPDASLGKFFHVVGGELTPDSVSLPTDNGLKTFKTGDMCGDKNVDLQVFLYKTDKDGYYTQEKLTDPAKYIMSPYSSVPAGDCVIIELDSPKDKTERMCRSYEVAQKIGKLKGERK